MSLYLDPSLDASKRVRWTYILKKKRTYSKHSPFPQIAFAPRERPALFRGGPHYMACREAKLDRFPKQQSSFHIYHSMETLLYPLQDMSSFRSLIYFLLLLSIDAFHLLKWENIVENPSPFNYKWQVVGIAMGYLAVRNSVPFKSILADDYDSSGYLLLVISMDPQRLIHFLYLSS